jgi:hypothetical protein
MWSLDIEQVISTIDNRKQFLGCFPLDQLPDFPTQFPKSCIINTQTSTKVGEHWIALILTNKHCFYFDSFGLPIIDQRIIEYLNPHYTIVRYSDVCIQHIESDKCGEFCIVFVTHVNSKTTYEQFISQFNLEDVRENDIIIEHWVISLVNK